MRFKLFHFGIYLGLECCHVKRHIHTCFLHLIYQLLLLLLCLYQTVYLRFEIRLDHSNRFCKSLSRIVDPNLERYFILALLVVFVSFVAIYNTLQPLKQFGP